MIIEGDGWVREDILQVGSRRDDVPLLKTTFLLLPRDCFHTLHTALKL
jgi:hypothetical protein